MRFLQTFFTLLFALVVGIGGGFVLLREGLLFYAVQRLTVDAEFLVKTNQWKNMQDQCRSSTSAGVEQLQIRFLDDERYNLELGCNDFRSVEWYQKKLPFMVKKTSGSAGFIYNVLTEEISGELTLELWGQRRVLLAENKTIKATWGKSELISGTLITSCQAHGLTCCDAVQESGNGNQLTSGVNDCPQQCFQSCVRRPQVLLFQTDPALDPATRQVTVTPDQATIVFHFVLETGASPIQTITLDYGDGNSEDLSPTEKEVVKQYFCEESECVYTAKITAVDQNGISASETRVNQLTVVVKSL